MEPDDPELKIAESLTDKEIAQSLAQNAEHAKDRHHESHHDPCRPEARARRYRGADGSSAITQQTTAESGSCRGVKDHSGIRRYRQDFQTDARQSFAGSRSLLRPQKASCGLVWVPSDRPSCQHQLSLS
jgi:hypothetical protein